MKICLSRACGLQRWFGLKYLILCIVASATSPIISSPVQADSAGCREAIHTAYMQMINDFANNKLAMSAVYLSDDYREVDTHGHGLDKAGCLKKLQGRRNDIRSVKSQCSIGSVTSALDGVHVKMTMHSVGKGVKHVVFLTVQGAFVNDLRVDDLWVKTQDGWRLKHRLTLLDDTHTRAG